MELATSRPRFRTDLVAECIEAEGQRFIDVIDPDTGDAFRFYEVEYSLACAMDGERDLAGLAQWAREELGIEPTAAELSTVISTLGHLGYLEHAPAAQAAAEVAARGRGDDDFGLQPGVIAPAADRGLPVRGGDVELGSPGLHARAPEAPLPRADVELGHAGGKPTARMDPLSENDDVELGSPGFASAEPVPSLRRSKTRPDQDDDGPTHLPPAAVADFDDEVSVDLSEHLSLRPDDVKEAVRMSRTMKAVDVPQDVLDELAEKEAQIAARAEAGRAGIGEVSMDAEEPTPPPAELPKLPPRLETKPVEKRADPVAEKKPVELPGKPVVVSKRDARPSEAPPKPATENPIAGNQPSGGTSTALIVVLVLLILGAAAFFVWKYVLNKPAETDETSSSSKTGPGPKDRDRDPNREPDKGSGKTEGSGKVITGSGTDGTGAPDKVEVAPPPTATLAAAEPATTEVKGGKGGVVFFAVAAGTEVAAGDVIVKYQGVQALEKKLGNDTSGLLWDIEKRVPKEIEKATSIRDMAAKAGKTAVVKAQDAKIKERSLRLAEKKQEVAELQAKIEALTIKAPIGGKVSSPVRAGKRVAPDGVVASIGGGEPTLVAVFEVAADKTPYAVDAAVRIASKDQPEQKANCAVSAVEGAKVTVACAADIGIAAGATVVLE